MNLEYSKDRAKLSREIYNNIEYYRRYDNFEDRKYEAIGNRLSIIQAILGLESSPKLDILSDIKIKAIQYGIEDLVSRINGSEICDIDDIILYADEIEWDTSNFMYKTIVSTLGDICMAIKFASEVLEDSTNQNQINSITEFIESQNSNLESLIRVGIDLTKDELIKIDEFSNEDKIKLIKLIINDIENINKEIADDIKNIVDLKLFISNILM